MYSQLLSLVVAAVRGASLVDLPRDIDAGHSLVIDLGFDSLAMARLGLTLEERFGHPILLDSWLSSEPDPSDLTIESLCTYVGSVVRPYERAAS